MTASENVNLDEKQLVRANEFLGSNPLAPYGAVEVVRGMSRRIRALDKSEIKLNPGEAMHLAQLAISHDLNPFSGEIWAWVQVKEGERHFSWMPGRRGLIRHANEQAAAKDSEWWSDERELTEHEKTELMIPKDALAFESKVFDKATMDEWRKTFNTLIDAKKTADEVLLIVGNPPCSIGYGVLTQAEIKKMPWNNKMPHVNRAKKRALMEALKGKYSLHFGGAFGGGGETFDEYIVDSKGAIDVEFEDVTDSRPAGYPVETFGESEERMDPKFWKGICEKMVKEELARDAFVAAELLAYSQFTPRELNEEWALKYFNHAKDILAEDVERPIKEIAPEAYGRLFETDKQKATKKPPAKKAKVDSESEEIMNGPKKEPKPTDKKVDKKPDKKESKKEPPKKSSSKEGTLLDDAGLTENEKEAYGAMAKDYSRYTPKHNLDWPTAYKYIDLKKVATSKKEFMAIVKTMKGDVRLGMCRLLGYL